MFNRHGESLPALVCNPLTELVIIFDMSLWNSTMALSCFEPHQCGEPFLPVSFSRIPFKTESIKLLLAFDRQTISPLALLAHPLTQTVGSLSLACGNSTVACPCFEL